MYRESHDGIEHRTYRHRTFLLVSQIGIRREGFSPPAGAKLDAGCGSQSGEADRICQLSLCRADIDRDRVLWLTSPALESVLALLREL